MPGYKSLCQAGISTKEISHPVLHRTWWLRGSRILSTHLPFYYYPNRYSTPGHSFLIIMKSVHLPGAAYDVRSQHAGLFAGRQQLPFLPLRIPVACLWRLSQLRKLSLCPRCFKAALLASYCLYCSGVRIFLISLSDFSAYFLRSSLAFPSASYIVCASFPRKPLPFSSVLV